MNTLNRFAQNRISKAGNSSTVKGEGGYLDEGKHQVKISDVDISGLEKDAPYVTLWFKNAEGSSHRENIFLLDYYNSDNYSWQFIQLVEALFEDIHVFEQLDKLFADAELCHATFMAFKTLQLMLTLEAGPGYIILPAEGHYYVVDAISKDILIEEHFKTITAAKEAAVKRNMKRSFRRVKRYDQCKNNNQQVFCTAIEGLQKAKDSLHNLKQIFDPGSFKNIAR